MKVFVYIAAALMVCGSVMAQERAAAGGTETQMTWSALSGQINSVQTNVTALDSKLTQVTICGKKGMLYAPGATGADSDGCLEASKAGNTTTNITSLVNAMNTNTNTVTSIVNCNKAGQTYNGTACVATAAPSCKLEVVTAAGKSFSAGGVVSTSNGKCPSGYSTVSSNTRQVGGSCSSCGSGSVTDYTCARVVCQ